jgi:hypothetical protein
VIADADTASKGGSITEPHHSNIDKYYYTISGEFNGLKFDALRDILKEYNFHHKPVTDKVHASFGTFHTSDQSSKTANYDPLFYKQRAAIKNVLGDHHTICDKTILFKTIKNLIPIGYKYIPSTYTVDEFEVFLEDVNNRTPYILKKKDAARQMGVLVITSKEDYLAAKKKLNIHSKNAIISKYITNPLTVNGKKMHIRVYILLSIQSGITRCYVFNKYKIYVAGAKYEEKDWLNPNIHISGADNTKQRYNWPSDVDWATGSPSKELLFELNECLRVLCLGMALSNIKTYEESDAGYHMYGVDILLTTNNKVYILEVNKRPGFGWVANDPEKGFPYNFSKKYFMFILNSTIFPFLGIKRQPEPLAEIIGNGALTPFAKLLTGVHRNVLIPIKDATKEEIHMANHKIHFHNKALSYQYISKTPANEKIIYLISNNNTIIGYLIILNRWINIAIIKEFQYRGIASAIIAQFMEIYSAIHFTSVDNNPIIYMRKNQISNIIQNIANKLHFTSNKKHYERKCKIK